MSRAAAKLRARAILSVLGEILWRSFGLFLKYLPAGFIAGIAAWALSKDIWLLAISIGASFVPALFEAWSEIGEEIARTAKVTQTGINRGFAKAIKLIEQTEKDLAEKKK